MTNTDLLQAMGNIAPELIADAAPDAEHKRKAKAKLKLIWLAAAVAACLLLSIVIVSATQDLTVNEIILSIMDKLDTMNPGETIDEANITFIKGGEMVSFTSMEEAMDFCSFECMFPTVFPKGIHVEKVIEFCGDSPEHKSIMFVTDYEDFTICVNNRITIDTAAWENPQVYKAKNLSFTMIQHGETQQAVAVRDGIEYIVYCKGIDESDFLMILDGIS